MLIILIITRCVSTFKSLTLQNCINSVILLLASSADCADLLNYTTLERIEDNDYAVAIVLFVFSISIFQFSVMSTSTRVPRKQKSTKIQYLVDICFSTELWAILIVMLTQDLPFLIVRFFLVFTYELFENTIFLIYIIKDASFIFIGVYRIYHIIKDFKNEESEVIYLESSRF